MATQSSPPPQDDPASGDGADDKPRLTEKEKKQNHIASGMRPFPPCFMHSS